MDKWESKANDILLSKDEIKCECVCEGKWECVNAYEKTLLTKRLGSNSKWIQSYNIISIQLNILK